MFKTLLAPPTLLLMLWALFFGFVTGCGDSSDKPYSATQKSERSASSGPGVFPFSHNLERQALIGPQACVECHAEEVADWEKSHHALANRPVSVVRDRPAFTPTRRIEESHVTYEMAEESGKFYLRVIHPDGRTVPYELVGVIGETPIRQYLAKIPGNKFQTISASYAVLEDRWVDVFAGEDREPGEWRHWLGQGMNWNANCAYCHTTEFEKGFDFEGNAYHSTWIQQGLACASCHTGLDVHVEAVLEGDYTRGLPALTRPQIDQSCATCHSRRDQLTEDAFMPGDHYHDHFGLSLPDQPGLYHPDGKILDEVFVWASFEMSQMAHKGVSCMDCHNPHTLKPILPVHNNMLCMRCHESGVMEATVIEPVAHSFHPEGSTGNQCVSCHMPKTTYMQVDPRADHGFHHPDPLLTKTHGIPNACNDCHQEETVEWAIEWTEKWYGEKVSENRQRQRAYALANAYAYEPEARDQLLELLETEVIPAWQATYIGLLGNFIPDASTEAAIREYLASESTLVRNRVVSALARGENGRDVLIDRLGDPARTVRLAAARGIAGLDEPVPEGQARDEWSRYLRFNSDRPQSLFILANDARREGRIADVQKYLARAILLDSANAEMYHQAAILLSGAGLNEMARRYLFSGWELAPDNPVLPYSLGLLAAEDGDLEAAVGFLEETVAMEPRFYRAWYNLSLAYTQLERAEDAARAMRRAQGH